MTCRVANFGHFAKPLSTTRLSFGNYKTYPTISKFNVTVSTCIYSSLAHCNCSDPVWLGGVALG